MEHQNSNVSISGFKLDLLKFQDKEALSNTFGLGGLHDFGPRMLDKTLGGIWSQPDILSELNEGASPFSYLNGRLLNMIDPSGMMADSTSRVPGAESSSSTAQTTTKSSEPIPLNQYQVPMYGAGSGSKSGSNYFPQTGFNTYPRGGTKSQISRDIKSIDPQTALDGVGMTEIPVVSQLAELVSAGMSFYKRDYTGGLIGLGSMFPVAGKTFEGLKIGRKLKRVFNTKQGVSSVLSKGELLRIENAATRIKKPITIIGSRAKGTAGAYSDWDYIIPGLNSKTWGKIKNSLPGSRSILDNTPRNIDIFKGPINQDLPYITIFPR